MNALGAYRDAVIQKLSPTGKTSASTRSEGVSSRCSFTCITWLLGAHKAANQHSGIRGFECQQLLWKTYMTTLVKAAGYIFRVICTLYGGVRHKISRWVPEDHGQDWSRIRWLADLGLTARLLEMLLLYNKYDVAD